MTIEAEGEKAMMEAEVGVIMGHKPATGDRLYKSEKAWKQPC